MSERHTGARRLPPTAPCVREGRCPRVAGRPMIGETVTHYRILEKLGEGGMGVVYKALDTKLERVVALKFLPAGLTAEPEARARLVREARSASALDHPNICTIHEIAETDDGRIFVCMALADGGSLGERLRDGPMSVDDAVAVALGVARALSAAHENSIVHRDVKPANVLFTRSGEVKLADFGLAKLVGSPGITRIGVTSGTAAYMSPEQARCEAVDRRTDLWSLGVVLYEMLAGTRPFDSEYEQAILYSVCNEDPTPLAGACPGAPEALIEIVERCLEKDRNQRCETADEIVAALSDLGAGTARIHAPRLRRRAQRLGKALRISAAAAILAAAAFVLRPAGRSAIETLLFRDRLPAERYVAVLTLEVEGDDPDHEAVAAGLSQHLSHRLTQVEPAASSLHVLPADDLVDNDVMTPRDARSRIGANLALAGNVARNDTRLEVHLELRNTESERVIAVANVNDDLGNLATLQDELVLRAASLVAPETKEGALPPLAGGTTVPAAFEQYLTGLGHLRLADDEDAVRTEAAVSRLGAAVELDPRFALAHSALARACYAMCSATKDTSWVRLSLASAARATETCEGLAEPHVTAGCIRLRRGDAAAAVRDFERALAAEPECLSARLGLASALEKSGDSPRAELAYKKVAEEAPGYWKARYSLGNFCYRRGRFDEAIAEFEATTAIVPGCALAHRNLGATCYHLERWSDARDALERSIEIHPTYGAYSNLATLYFQQTRYADAVAMYEKALELHDTDYRIWGNLGSACLWLPGEEERSRKAYERAIEQAERTRRLVPDNPELLSVLAGYYASVGRTDEATGLVDRAVELAPDEAEVAFQAGHTYEIIGDRKAALDWICRALELGYSRAQVEATPALRALCTDERYRAAARRSEGVL